MGSQPRTDVNRLIEGHRTYAHAVAAEVLRTLPPNIDRNDLMAAAELGLVEAAGAFDPSRGVQFKTFSYYRIRGAVYDALRKMGWFSKSLYEQYRFEMAANEYMKDYSSAPPAAGTPEQDYDQLKNIAGNIVSCYLLSLDAEPQEVPADPSESPEEQMRKKEGVERMRNALAQLPEKNRQVLEGYYFHDQSLEEIGRRLGLSKSWVCRVHAKSLEMLREIFERTTPLRQETFPAALR